MKDQQQGDIEVVVGRIGKPHGIRGEVTLDVRTDEPERRFAPGATLRAEAPAGADRRPSTLTVARARWHQSTLLVTFEELTDRNAAEAARGTVLHATIGRDEAPEDPDEYYDHQLVGLEVVDLDGTVLGTVKALVHGSAQDLLTVRTADGRDALVPFVAALVPEVDLEAGRLVVADRPGLVSPFPEEAGETGEAGDREPRA
ncbi:ribosome maturation factor RimM [Nocardioides flavus (ex Wang et al. 2016)]|uniref:Ribosome maturation factor RimM n=1 Tax=Nocardioides flavus (ex Wang et al. 2016) TaxID=2058780 RepID=A0ABQ3HKE7_9ACTN|nr:ribosome maturation factor RimM [Nocardioides flavus (ex Wang et al. 2016)]GHE17395.1 ribosome maturation factor RimM [Nocardioides flavus (ex Wang et al. 2016)]